MKPVFLETGAELVASSALSTKQGIAGVLPGFWGKFPEQAKTDLLGLSLTSQLNMLVGGENLEKSILYGKDYFKGAIIDKYGEENYVYLSEQINDISIQESDYLAQYLILGEEGVENLRTAIIDKAIRIQDYMLELEFDKKMQSVDSLESGKKFLTELLEFGSNRLKKLYTNETQDGSENIVFEDASLRKHFEDYKAVIESNFGKTNVDYAESNLVELPVNDVSGKISDDEQMEVEQMAMAFERISKNRLRQANKGKIASFVDKIFGKKQELLPPNRNFENQFIVKQKDIIPIENNVGNRNNIEREK